jgi:hypothetical protein
MIDVESYDRTHALSPHELHHMQILVTRIQEGGKGWHKAARPALHRLLHPLEAVLDHLGAMRAGAKLGHSTPRERCIAAE